MKTKSKLLITSNVLDICFPVCKVKESNYETISSTEYSLLADLKKPKMTFLNSCSDRYELVPNTDVFLRIETILKENHIYFNVNYTMHDYSSFHAIYLLPDFFVVLPKRDKNYLKFEVFHSYNGLIQYTMVLGFYRVVCSNGLVIPLEGHESNNLFIKGKHTEKIIKSIETLVDTLTRFIDNKSVFSDRYLILSDRKVEKWEDRIIEVMNATNINEGKNKVNLIAIKKIIDLEVNDRFASYPSDWIVYNAINEGYIYNDSLNSIRPHLRIEKDSKVMQWIWNHPLSN